MSFCPACSAPQIRVSAAPPPDVPFVPGVVRLATPGQIAWPDALRAAALAGGGAAFLSILLAALIGPGFVLGMVLGGCACVAFYRRKQPLATMTGALGARLGAVAGLFGFGVFAIVQSLLIMASPREELRATFREIIEHASAQNPDPKFQEAVKMLLTPEGMAALVIAGLILSLLLFVVFSVIGGGLWASLQKREDR